MRWATACPDLGDTSQIVLTPLQERQIGQQSMLADPRRQASIR